MTIELISLVVFGHHGYLEEERRLGQRFLVDLWVDVEESATASDRIEDTVDYRRLAGLVREVFAGPERLLLEGLAGAIADGLHTRVSPQVFYYYKSFSVYAEHVRSRQALRTSAVDASVANSAIVLAW